MIFCNTPHIYTKNYYYTVIDLIFFFLSSFASLPKTGVSKNWSWNTNLHFEKNAKSESQKVKHDIKRGYF